MAIINRRMLSFDANHPEALPDLKLSNKIVVASDYSGEHQNAQFMVYSIMLAGLDGLSTWERKRCKVRKDYLQNGRRMSFKALRERQRQRALRDFLSAADYIPGLCVLVAVQRDLGSLFERVVSPPIDDPVVKALAQWPTHILEKAGLVAHITGLFLAGLCRPGQDVLWFTDEDAIAANPQRLRELTSLFGWVVSYYLTFDLGHIRCGTAACDDGSRSIEDLVAVADVTAGALYEQLEMRGSIDCLDDSKVFWLMTPQFSKKTREITWWLANTRMPLKRLVFVIDRAAGANKPRVSFFHFHNQLA